MLRKGKQLESAERWECKPCYVTAQERGQHGPVWCPEKKANNRESRAGSSILIPPALQKEEGNWEVLNTCLQRWRYHLHTMSVQLPLQVLSGHVRRELHCPEHCNKSVILYTSSAVFSVRNPEMSIHKKIQILYWGLFTHSIILWQYLQTHDTFVKTVLWQVTGGRYFGLLAFWTGMCSNCIPGKQLKSWDKY